TTRWVEAVYGCRPAVDDPAEAYHEASKLTPSQADRQLEGARRLAARPDLRVSATRAVRRGAGPTIPLPEPAPLEMRLDAAIGHRRSRRSFTDDPISTSMLSALLCAAYGVSGLLDVAQDTAQAVRTVPSAGALYPLDLYVSAQRVAGLRPAVYHFDPLARVLERHRPGLETDELESVSPYADTVSGCAALVLVVAVFGRTRFKYGLRGYRFALLEAGHLAQNLLLAASALELAAVPIGGFFDRRADQLLGLDGVNESVLYTIPIGRGRA